MRLPTEAEWEYACRAGTTTKRHFGDDADRLGEYAWYQDNAHDTTHPVAQKKPNPWGLYDMLGNVAELCSDRHEWEYYKSSPMDDPTGPESGPTVVIRGGIYCLSARYCRSAYRGMVAPPEDDVEGFRVVLESPDHATESQASQQRKCRDEP